MQKIDMLIVVEQVILLLDDDNETACKKLIQGLYKINKDFDVPSMKLFGINQKNFEAELEIWHLMQSFRCSKSQSKSAFRK